MMRPRTAAPVLLCLATLALSACQPDPVAVDEASEAQLANVDLPTPGPLVTVDGPATSLELWPYTTVSPGAAASDPMNLVFPDMDARSLRAALMMLDGDRSAFGFPNQAPFDCTWKEAMGANQASYSTASGWTASAIQLECGDYQPIRFHIRMFPMGAWTVANAHFEVIIGGTNQHEVISWELAEQLVTVDFARSGILAAPPTPTDIITEAPTFRAINPLVYNALPDGLKMAIGGPMGPVGDPVPMPNDGRAIMLNVAQARQGDRMVARREFVLDFDQTIPKPFCADGPLDWLHVEGQIQFNQRVVVSGDGNFMTWFHAHGGLELVPVNPLTGEVTGEPMMARVAERDRSVVTDQVTLVSTAQMQLLLPGSNPATGSLFATLRIGPGAADAASLEITCRS